MNLRKNSPLCGRTVYANESTEYRTEYANKAETNFRYLSALAARPFSGEMHIIYQGAMNLFNPS
jgi:hypothetical protein